MIFFELFYTFFFIGLFTIGGGYAMIPLIESTVVEKGWIDSATLYNMIGISEATPGPFAVNISTFVGNQVGGPFGAFCATIGVVLPSFIIILIIAIILKRFMKSKYVRGALNGVQPIVLSLILASALLLLVKVIFFNSQTLQSEFKFDLISLTILIDISVFYFLYKKITKKKLHPIILILFCAVIGIIAF